MLSTGAILNSKVVTFKRLIAFHLILKAEVIMSEKWKLTGTYFEACSCDIACPCTFLSAPTTGNAMHLLDGI